MGGLDAGCVTRKEGLRIQDSLISIILISNKDQTHWLVTAYLGWKFLAKTAAFRKEESASPIHKYPQILQLRLLSCLIHVPRTWIQLSLFLIIMILSISGKRIDPVSLLATVIWNKHHINDKCHCCKNDLMCKEILFHWLKNKYGLKKKSWEKEENQWGEKRGC